MAKVVCVEVFHYGTKKGTETTNKNQVYDTRDAVVKAKPAAFLGMEEWAALNDKSNLVETTTAAPNETRDVKKPAAKKPAAKKPAGKKRAAAKK